MDLSTSYLGLRLPHPLMPGASPMALDLDTVRRLEDAGAAAIVMPSLFEEACGTREPSCEPRLGKEEYLDRLAAVRKAVSVPVIASLNGTVPGRWLDTARLLEEAGARALELNLYSVATDAWDPPQAIERRAVEVVRMVKSKVRLPVAIKLLPFYTSLPHFAQQLEDAGAEGLVLFNRFYHPEVVLEGPRLVPKLSLSDPSELSLRTRWLAVLSGRVRASLAVTGGVHTAADALKAVLCGAHAVQMVSALLLRGPDHLKAVREEMEGWLGRHGCGSLEGIRGRLRHLKFGEPAVPERVGYQNILQAWKGPAASAEDPWFE
jgi:dihydroorotate dehydrogenase (fumarate)